ncbi:shikimate dehydrogenase [Orbus hercynius]|uniref:shikimate dehydrogenase (NADP(+)) n=1 Tax=Orbus hercynius TaxID=593135 RepID=A0A495REF8_9GAMM|nr:shikimate 5-dehydrogenase [Orbus hercynius]RKS85873.1 shikimate dehydrogenase [Orbus hercynius]
MINKDTMLCMSLSARPGNFGTRFHNSLYEQLGLNFVYKAFSTNNIEDAIKGIRALSIRGCAISMPFKEACMPFLDTLTDSVLAIDSVNTIVNDNGHLTAYNTDYIAIRKLISQYRLCQSQSVMIHGSGGMAKAVIAAFYDAGFKNVTILARHEAAGQSLAQKYHFSAVTHPTKHYDILVNATPIGMSGGADSDKLSFPAELIHKACVVFEVIAMPVCTPLINEAKRHNLMTISGREVMILQAVEQFILYTGQTPTDAQISIAADLASQA